MPHELRLVKILDVFLSLMTTYNKSLSSGIMLLNSYCRLQVLSDNRPHLYDR